MTRDTPSGFVFDYDRAFSRNIGWVTKDEQQRLRRARVAVAGLGGVGGAHVLALSRLGIANFNIADFDEFDVHNMNRQAAAFMSSMGRPKIDVVAEMARDSNPEQYARFIAGVSPAMLSRQYLVAPEAVNFKERRGPSTGMACELCAGLMGTSVLKLLLNRGPLRAAPWGMHFDAYRGRLKHTWRPWGNAHPLQRLLVALIKPVLRGK